MRLKTTTITLRDRLYPNETEMEFLDALMASYQNSKRILFSKLYGKQRESDVNQLKRDFCKKHQMTSTQYNSIKSECDSIFKSQLELQEFYEKEYKEKIKAIREWIEHKQNVVTKSLENLESDKISDKHRQRLLRKIKNTKFKLHHKQRKLAALTRRHAQFEESVKQKGDFQPSIVFGSQKLLKKRHNLKANGYERPEQWKDDWNFARSSEAFLLGDSTELHRNRELKGVTAFLESSQGRLNVTIPYILRESFTGRTFPISVEFSERTLKHLRETLNFSYLRKVKKGDQFELKEARLPISYRVIKKQFKKALGTEVRYYLQTIIKVPIPQESSLGRGAIGVDVNADHLAVGVVDRHGNPKASFSIPYRPYEGSTAQNEAALGAIINDLCDLAELKGLPIVIERLKLAFLMAKMKHSHGRKVNKRLSSLSYRKIFSFFESIAARRKVTLIKVFAGYSSKLGAINYLNLRNKVSSHEAAAFVLARRGMNLKDYLDISGLKDSAPDEREILSLLQGGPAGPAVLRKKKISEKINFNRLKKRYLQFDPGKVPAEEFETLRLHIFTAGRFTVSCA